MLALGLKVMVGKVLSSGISPNLQFCWDGTGIFNHMIYRMTGNSNEVMKNYTDKRMTDDGVAQRC